MNDNMENLQTHVKVYKELTIQSCSQLSIDILIFLFTRKFV